MDTTKLGSAMLLEFGARLALIVAVALLPALSASAASSGSSSTDVGNASAVVKAGQEIAHNGAQGVAPCSSCHAPQTVAAANGMYPQLRGLSARYIGGQLHDFQNGSRKNAIMGSIAKQLSDEQIKAVASYYASLTPAPLGAPDSSEALLERGRQLAKQGDLQNRVGSCINCHGVGGSGEFPAIPHLIYQPAGYLAAQLKAWQKGTRHNNELMHDVAEKLSSDDIKAVAAYFASLRNDQ